MSWSNTRVLITRGSHNAISALTSMANIMSGPRQSCSREDRLRAGPNQRGQCTLPVGTLWLGRSGGVHRNITWEASLAPVAHSKPSWRSGLTSPLSCSRSWQVCLCTRRVSLCTADLKISRGQVAERMLRTALLRPVYSPAPVAAFIVEGDLPQKPFSTGPCQTPTFHGARYPARPAPIVGIPVLVWSSATQVQARFTRIARIAIATPLISAIGRSKGPVNGTRPLHSNLSAGI